MIVGSDWKEASLSSNDLIDHDGFESMDAISSDLSGPEEYRHDGWLRKTLRVPKSMKCRIFPTEIHHITRPTLVPEDKVGSCCEVAKA